MLESRAEYSKKYLIYAYDNADDLLRVHSEAPFDIIFLDIVMPYINGIEAAREIRKGDKEVKLVFLTSSREYAVESYSVKANNYLLKPVDAEALYSCLDELVSELVRNEKFISVRSYETMYRIPLSEIEYLEAQNKHVAIFLRNGSQINSVDPLYSFEDKLTQKDGFFKCHRSYIVNMYCVDSYTPKELVTNSQSRIPISRNVQKEFSNAYFHLIFGKE